MAKTLRKRFSQKNTTCFTLNNFKCHHHKLLGPLLHKTAFLQLSELGGFLVCSRLRKAALTLTTHTNLIEGVEVEGVERLKPLVLHCFLGSTLATPAAWQRALFRAEGKIEKK